MLIMCMVCIIYVELDKACEMVHTLDSRPMLASLFPNSAIVSKSSNSACRFGCLSRASAVAMSLSPWMECLLVVYFKNTDCMAMEGNVQYFLADSAVIAFLGVQIKFILH